MTLDFIKKEIKKNSEISFADFMQIALYHPTYGYYSSCNLKIGEQGDFITAPELTPVFGYTIANQCKDILAIVDNPVIFEFGAGTGKLCVDILTYLEKINLLPDIYYILEVSGGLKKLQKELIKKHIPHLENRVKWLTNIPDQQLNGVVIANEVLDAMPVHIFFKDKEKLSEVYISLDEKNNFIEILKPMDNIRLQNNINEFVAKDLSNYKSEVNLFIDGWIKEIYKFLTKGAVFILDYGFPAHEYYHPDRNTGTIMCHYKHKSHTNPLVNIGKQDITAHVNFTHVAEAAFNIGFNVSGYTNQANFLINNDILNLLESNTQTLKILLEPSEMGELFKVLALTKGISIDLRGFKYNDRRASL